MRCVRLRVRLKRIQNWCWVHHTRHASAVSMKRPPLASPCLGGSRRSNQPSVISNQLSVFGFWFLVKTKLFRGLLSTEQKPTWCLLPLPPPLPLCLQRPKLIADY